jgi:hypothetical protein
LPSQPVPNFGRYFGKLARRKIPRKTSLKGEAELPFATSSAIDGQLSRGTRLARITFFNQAAERPGEPKPASWGRHGNADE